MLPSLDKCYFVSDRAFVPIVYNCHSSDCDVFMLSSWDFIGKQRTRARTYSPIMGHAMISKQKLFQVDDFVSGLLVAQLLFLQSESRKKPIHLYINSPGSSIRLLKNILEVHLQQRAER